MQSALQSVIDRDNHALLINVGAETIRPSENYPNLALSQHLQLAILPPH
jgi:hypothetical protein